MCCPKSNTSCLVCIFTLRSCCSSLCPRQLLALPCNCMPVLRPHLPWQGSPPRVGPPAMPCGISHKGQLTKLGASSARKPQSARCSSSQGYTLAAFPETGRPHHWSWQEVMIYNKFMTRSICASCHTGKYTPLVLLLL